MYTNLAEKYIAFMFKVVLLLRVVSLLSRYTTSHSRLLLIIILAAMIALGLIATALFCYVIQVALYKLCSLDSTGSRLVP